MLFACTFASAQPAPPSAGTQLQQIPPPPTPDRLAAPFAIRPVDQAAVRSSDASRMQVNRLRVEGASLYTESELLAVTGFQPGSQLSLAQLQAMAANITAFYRQRGYLVAQALILAQDIQGGVVTLTVAEGSLGKIEVRNRSALADSLVYDQLDGVVPGQPVNISSLESGLLLLSDIPGVQANATLSPGAATGHTDLLVDVVPGGTVTGSVDADNAGNRYTGEYRVGGTLNLNNLAGRGDVASLRLLTSGAGLNYARAAYQMQFGKATVGVSYSWLRYELGREFSALQAHGMARVASLYGSYPLIRSRDTNLYALGSLDAKTFEDRADATASAVDKKSQVLLFGLRGDHRDRIGGGGLSSVYLAASTGNLDIRTPSVRAFDALNAQSNGHFTKLNFSASRVQAVSTNVSFYGAVSGQLASRNLDSSEKMELGGAWGVRAYPQGEAFGDEGLLATLEARYLVPGFADRLPGQLQLVGFVDAGTVTVNQSPWFAGDNRRTLSGAGVGLNWSMPANFSIRTSYARRLGSEPAQSAPDRRGRFWVQAVKYF
ncbi:MAG: ShlB/FhaC/HecB family hemolysin secretion/activation protein [Comamonadaceae bacterium]|nr:MAG: ShlB/FhaC/HecB family hemolysin secretion/activation protein [Comamonadaceae bacterium]